MARSRSFNETDFINQKQTHLQQKDPFISAITQIFFDLIKTDMEKPVPFTN